MQLMMDQTDKTGPNSLKRIAISNLQSSPKRAREREDIPNPTPPENLVLTVDPLPGPDKPHNQTQAENPVTVSLPVTILPGTNPNAEPLNLPTNLAGPGLVALTILTGEVCISKQLLCITFSTSSLFP